MVGFGDVTFNARRNILGSIPVGGKNSYHLHSIGYSGQKGGYNVQLLRKSKWYAQYSIAESKCSFHTLIQKSIIFQIKIIILQVLISILQESW